MPVEGKADAIGGELTQELEGSSYLYQYTSGYKYGLIFENGGVRFEMFAAEGETPPPPPIDAYGNEVDVLAPMGYRARKLRPNQYLVHWILRPGIHVALVLDLEANTVNVAAMMPPNQWEFFDTATIISVTRSSAA